MNKKAVVAIALGLGGLWLLMARAQKAGESQDTGGFFLPDVFGFIKAAATNIYGETFGYWDMQLSPSGIELLKTLEGVRYTVYDAQPNKGDWTIGVGHKILRGEESLMRARLSEDQVNEFLQKDLYSPANTGREGAVKTATRLLKVTVSQQQFDALVCYIFNYGPNSPAVKSLIALVNNGDDTGAANFILNSKSNPNRRKIEAALYRSGIND